MHRAVRRLNTVSLISEPGGPFINIDRLDLKKYADHPVLSRILFEYILYQLNNPKKALELASLAIVAQKCEDWWWKAQSGRCFRRLNLLRDAEKHLKSSLKDAVRAIIDKL
jgi:tetratricopeptide repeat protein 8